MQSITESLNKQQAQAVTAEPKSALILAGAGSGKTRVLTSRIAYLLQQNMAHPSEILAVTFTNKAAKEMLARLQNMIPINPRAMWVGTFHGLCNRLLRLHHQEAGLPSTFAILDMSDQLGVIKRVMKANGIDTEEFKPREVQNFINRCKEEGKEETIVFGLTGTGYFDLVAYQKFNDHEMTDTIPTDEQLAASIAQLPKVEG